MGTPDRLAIATPLRVRCEAAFGVGLDQARFLKRQLDERRIVRRYREASLRSLCRCRRDGFELSSFDEQLHDLLPPLASWQP
jgi:hypothetical protein